mmetsp:Transcript_16624/g.40069  ORF Transcript_16624/g.40069 Transcript_16624/m.40069 type:complete len:193 (+) Transcript_16624:96-674(+)
MPPIPKKKGGANDVAVMEQRLALLKEQMEDERLRREELLASSGGDSMWQSGRRGVIRGPAANVGQLVRARARPAAGSARAPVPPAPARTSPVEEHDRESPALSAASTDQSVFDAGDSTSPLPVSRPVSREARPTPFQRPPSPKEVVAMECQTDRIQWTSSSQATPRSRPPSARPGGSSYFDKIMKARQAGSS